MKRFKLRTFFMMLCVIVGVTSLTLVLSFGKGTKQKLLQKLERLVGSNDIVLLAGGAVDKGGRRMGDQPSVTLTLEDIHEINSRVSIIENYDAVLMIPSRSVKYGAKSMDLRIMGNTANAETVWNRGVSSGSFFTEADVKKSTRVALVGINVVEQFFDGIDPVGEQIRIGSVPFKIIGVLEPLGIDPHGMDRDMEIGIPISTAMRRLTNADYITSTKFQITDESMIVKTAEEIRQILRERHHIQTGETDDFKVITPEDARRIIGQVGKLFSVFLPIVAGVAMLAGGIVIAALMLITVNERTREIGLRKALGARAKDILIQFVAETTLITVTGGITGFLLGGAIVFLLASKMHIPAVLPWEAFILGLVSSIVIGIVAGIMPARRAALLTPVDGLR